jgi:NAD(P)-dependent dehydrogenase (short-subunit alcohol dehydrogenase family)
MSRLAGRIALVTGAGGGLGRGIAEALAAEGAAIAILEIRGDSGEETAQRIRSCGAEAIAIAGDVTRREDVVRAVAVCRDRWGRLDVLVNNAGVSMEEPRQLADLPIEEWRRVVEVNLTGALICIQEAVPLMRESGGGSVINLTSISARACYPGRGAYAASKSALETLTRQAALELAPWRIRCNSMSLGWFRTALNEHVYQRRGELERRNATVPLGRIGTTEDAGRLAVFLASEDSSYITGESIESDGGLLASSLHAIGELARLRPTPDTP